MYFSDLDVVAQLQVQACNKCGTLVDPDERRLRGKCACGSVRSELRMITKKEARAFVAGRLHCYGLFDGRMAPQEISHGILSLDPVIIEHYREVLARFAKVEELRFNRRQHWLKKEAWAPIRYPWLRRWVDRMRRTIRERKAIDEANAKKRPAAR